MTTTTQLSLSHLVEGQGSAETTVNDALNRLDAVVKLTVIDKDLSAPPGSPAEGDRYLVGASATGDWAGHENSIAVYLSGWAFLTPTNGWSAYVIDELTKYVFDGTSWVGPTECLDSLTAYAGGGQANATQLNYGNNQVLTVGSAGDSVKLPPQINGNTVRVYNVSASNSINVYPQSGEAINALATNSPKSLGTARGTSYYGLGGRWVEM